MRIFPKRFASQIPLKSVAAWLLAFVVCYVVTMLTLWWGDPWTAFFLGSVFLLLLAVGWVLGLILAWRSAADQKAARRAIFLRAIAPLLAIPLALLVFRYTALPLQYSLDWLWFKAHESTLEEIISLIEGENIGLSPGTEHRFKDVTYLVDQGPPKRVAFEFRKTHATSQYILRHEPLFGDTKSFSCRRLSDEYDLCSFSPGNSPLEEIQSM